MLVVGGLLLAACQLEPLSPALPPSATVGPTATVAPVVEETPMHVESKAGLTGVVIAESDVTGLPDTPLAGHTVLAVAQAAAAAAIDLPPENWDDRSLRFLNATVERDAEGVFATTTDSDGRYELPLPPGVYALCLADVAADGIALQTHGCGQIQVEAGALQTVDISSGFGEILLQPAPEK
jgi:hypothetical protein